MSQCPASDDKKKLLGQRVLIKGNKYGTLHYFGNIPFAQGLWCGIELDEEVGENDGIVNNIHYFKCKKKYGMFIPASDVNVMSCDDMGIGMSISDLVLNDHTKTPCHMDFDFQNYDFSVSSDSHLVSSQNSHQRSEYVIPKESNKKLSIINEEVGFEYSKSVNFLGFSNREDLSTCENIFSVEQALISSVQSFSQESGVATKNEENCDSDDSLGILPHLLDSFNSCDDLFDVDKMSFNLNATVVLHDTGGKVEESYISQQETEELVTSPISFVPNILLTKSDESPVCMNTNMPKYASTPKHETNFSYVIDDAVSSMHTYPLGAQFYNVDLENKKNAECILNKTKDIEVNSKCVLPVITDKEFSINDEDQKNAECILNKTKDIEATHECVLPVITNKEIPVNDENQNPEKNILNVTFNNLDPLNSRQVLLNITFDNHDILCDDIYAVPVIDSHDKSYQNKLDMRHHSVPDCNEFIKNIIPEELHTIDFDLKDNYENEFSENPNILNVTCGIQNPSVTNIAHSENLEHENSKNAESIPVNVLNTTISYPQEAEKDIIAEETSKILNTTYGIIEEPIELERTVEVLQPCKNMNGNINSQTVTKNKNKKVISSFKADSCFLSGESKNKLPKFDVKKNTRRSVGSFRQTSTSNAEVENKDRRKSASGNMYMSSKLNDMPIKYYPKSSSSIKSANSFPSLKSESAGIKIEKKLVSEVNLKDVHLLNETIDLNPCIPEVGKTIVKKTRSSMRVYEHKSSLDTCDASLFKTDMPIKYYPKSGSSIKSVNSFPSLKSKSAGIKIEEKKLVSEVNLKDVHLLNETINLNPCIPEVGKTIVKKTRSSMRVYEHKSSLDTCDASLFKTQEKMIPFVKRKSINTSVTVKTKVTQLPDNGFSVSLNKKNLKATACSMPVGKLQVIRKPENCTLLQKNGSVSNPSFKTNHANLYKSNSVIPVVKPASLPVASKISVSSSQSAGYHLIQKSNNKVISDYQTNGVQTTQTSGVVSKPSSSSKIPSVSQSTRKPVSGVKSSLIPKRTESASYKRKSQYDLRKS